MIIWKDKDKLFLFLLILSSQTQELTYAGPFDLSDLVIGLFLLKLIIDNLMNPEKKNILCFLNLLPLVLLCLTIIPISYRRISFLSPFFPIKWFFCLFLVINAIRTIENVFFILKTYIWVTFFSSIVAIIQSGVFFYFGIILLRNRDESVLRLRFEETPFGPLFRVSGFFEFIHNFAIVVTIAFLILLYFILSRNYRLVGKYTSLVMMSTMLIALFLTFYKGVGIVIPVAIIFLLYWIAPSKFVHITAGLAAIFILLYISGITDKFIEIVSEQISIGDFHARLQLDRIGIQKLLTYPLFGVGLFSSPVYTANSYDLPPHNALILIADELGIFGFVTLLCLYSYLFLRLIYKSIQTRNVDSKILLKALSVSFVAFLIYVQVEPGAYNFWCWIYFGIVESAILFVDRQNISQLA